MWLSLTVALLAVAIVAAFPFEELEGEFCDDDQGGVLALLLVELDDDDDGEAIGARKRQANLKALLNNDPNDDDDSAFDSLSVQGGDTSGADVRLVFFQSAELDVDDDDGDDDDALGGKRIALRNAALLPRQRELLVSLNADFEVLGFDFGSDAAARAEYNLVPAGTLCKKGLELAFRASVALLLVMLMLGMGAATSLAQFKRIVRKKRTPFLIGFASQYIFLPALGLALAFALQLPDGIAIGLVLVAASPGGTTSQLYTYLSKGDVALSLSMTFASTITSFGFIPLFSLLYLQPFVGDNADDGAGIVIPFVDIVLSLLLVLVPTAIGLAIREFCRPSVAKFVEKAGAIAGVLGIMAAIGIGIALFVDVFDQAPEVYAAAFLLPTIGILAGYLFGFLGRQTRRHCRTISFECGLQNSSLTITLAALAFEGVLQKEVLVIPLLYSLLVFVPAVSALFFYRWVAKFDPESEKALESDDENEDPETGDIGKKKSMAVFESNAAADNSDDDGVSESPAPKLRSVASGPVLQVATTPKNFYEDDDVNEEMAKPTGIIDENASASGSDADHGMLSAREHYDDEEEEQAEPADDSSEERRQRREETLKRTRELEEVDAQLRESL